MRKINQGLLDETPRPRRVRLSTILTVVIGLLLAPLVREGSLVCVAQWKAMYGSAEPAETPVFDFLADTFKRGRQDLGTVLAPAYRSLPWRPAVVIPFAIAWTGVAALILRKC